MKVVYSVFLLALLTGAATCLFIRKHIYVDTALPWSDAQAYCRKNYVDLSTIDTPEELHRFKDDVRMHIDEGSWISLSKGPNENIFKQWSDGSVLKFTQWGEGEPDQISSEHCVHTRNAIWYNSKCDTTRKFFCYTWKHEVIVVQEMKSWDEALEHCRKLYTDLISLTTETALLLANNKSMNIQTPSVWTGLRFQDGSWFWVNKEPQGNLTTLPSCPASPFFCGARKTGADVWENLDCRKKINFICYHQKG